MPTVTVTVPHALHEEEALRRIKDRYDAMKSEHLDRMQDLEEEWTGNTLRCRFRVMGLKVEGAVTAQPATVRVDAVVPLAAIVFKAAIEKNVREELQQLLS